MRALLIVLVLLPVAAFGQVPGNSYLPQPDEDTAYARSIAEGIEMGVPEKANVPWWAVVVIPKGGVPQFDKDHQRLPTTACPGGVYIEIEPAMRVLPTVGMDDFTANPRAPVITAGVPVMDKGQVQRAAATGLSGDERAALVSYADLAKQGCVP